MKRKLGLIVGLASFTVLAGQASAVSLDKRVATEGFNKGASALSAAAPAQQNTKSTARADRVFTPEKGLVGQHRYIVQLADAPLATYRGGVAGLRATSIDVALNERGQRDTQLNTRSAAARAYTSYLTRQQSTFLTAARAAAGRDLKAEHNYRNSFNGVAVEMTQSEAIEVAKLGQVVRITRDQEHALETDRGPQFIGAHTIWDGSAMEGVNGFASQGEGMLVGIIDSGINGDHPAFAATGDDGYEHINPFGDGVFMGECFDTPDLTCNNKLVGRYNMVASATSSEDEDGHGTHVASTAAGNVLSGVPLPDAEGNDLNYSLGTLSGVAPHANIVAFRVCNPLCAGGDIIAAVDIAIDLGIDVLNHSIGSASGSPWNDPKSLSFKGARAAGISMANSAGNSGTGASGYAAGSAASTGGAPWSSSIAASTHDRAFPEKTISFSGAPGAPAPISGRAITDGYTGRIVYAGDYDNPNDPNGDPAQCLQPFPAGTFDGDEIVVCDRGAIARVQKGINARDGGAAGFVLCNVDGGAAFLADDPHVVPSIQISAEDCNGLRDWLASGSGHVATIDPTGAVVSDPFAGDQMATFSSRGPYTGFDWLVPSVTAPGVAIFAGFRNGIEYAFLQGTSMSSPHVAGSMTLVKAVQPTWTDEEVLSALIMTGSDEVREAVDPNEFDGPLRDADPFDYGGGRVQLEYAAAVGIVLDEEDAAYDAANPALGGDPRTLNMAYLYDSECLGACGFTRKLHIVRSGTYTMVSQSDDGIAVSASPSTFTAAAGDTVDVTFDVSVAGIEANQWVFGHAVWEHDGGAPDAQMPVIVRTAAAVFPDKIELTADRDAGSATGGGIRTAEISGLEIEAFGLAVPEDRTVEISGSVGDFTPYTGESTVIEFFSVPVGSVSMVAETIMSTAPDADMFVGKDLNQDRQITPDEELCQSGNQNSIERCDLDAEQLAGGGTYWVAVFNFEGSGDDIVDTTELSVSIVSPSLDGSITAEAPGAVPGGEPFDIRVLWNLDMEVGQTYVGAVELNTAGGSLGMIPVEITRAEDDLKVTANADSANVGDILTYSIEIGANLSNEDRTYVISASHAPGLEIIPESVTGGDSSMFINGNLIWTVDMPSLTRIGRTYQPSINGPNVDVNNPLYNAACNTNVPGLSGYIDLAGLGIGADSNINGNNVSFNVLQNQNVNLYGAERLGGFNVTDDGFVYFNATPGASPGNQVSIPNAAMPNDMAAVLWTDMEVVFDPTEGGGVTSAPGGANISVIEWDNMQRAPAGSSTDRIDFEAIFSGRIDDSPNAPEVVFAYDNIVGDWSDAVIGIENETGSAGTEFSGSLSDGMMICWDYAEQPTDATLLTFQARVLPSASGGDATMDVFNRIMLPGSVEETVSVSTSIESSDSDSDGVDDAMDNCAFRANPAQIDADADGYGNLCDGDFNDDDFVDLSDVRYLLLKFGTDDAEVDMNSDGIVDAQDIELFKLTWLQSPGPSGQVD
ncbi:MAG: S8 family serine peptidase [Pseudomonadota bacterium]